MRRCGGSGRGGAADVHDSGCGASRRCSQPAHNPPSTEAFTGRRPRRHRATSSASVRTCAATTSSHCPLSRPRPLNRVGSRPGSARRSGSAHRVDRAGVVPRGDLGISTTVLIATAASLSATSNHGTDYMRRRGSTRTCGELLAARCSWCCAASFSAVLSMICGGRSLGDDRVQPRADHARRLCCARTGPNSRPGGAGSSPAARPCWSWHICARARPTPTWRSASASAPPHTSVRPADLGDLAAGAGHDTT